MHPRLAVPATLSACAIVTCCFIPAARADEEPRWIDRSVYLDDIVGVDTESGISGLVSGDWAHWQDDSKIDVRPSFDVSVGRHLTLGGLVDLHVDHGTTSVTAYYPASGAATNESLTTADTGVLVAPRIGWKFDLSRRFALWPRFSIGVGPMREVDHGAYQDSHTAVLGTLEGSVDLVAQLVGPLYATFGPDVRYSDFRRFDRLGQEETVYIAMRSSLGLAF